MHSQSVAIASQSTGFADGTGDRSSSYESAWNHLQTVEPSGRLWIQQGPLPTGVCNHVALESESHGAVTLCLDEL
eukprot:2493830-Karenia_brevis.AAC.1